MQILFPVVPFAELDAAALGVSLLKAQCAREGHRATVTYPAFDLAERLGHELYGCLAGQANGPGVATATPTESLIGEWFFAGSLFGEREEDADYVRRFLESDPRVRPFVPSILEERGRIDEFVEDAVDAILRLEPDVVGFSTTFYQTLACLTLARALAARPSAPIVVFGGANCHGEMGRQLLRSFPFIDHVCTGEGDLALPALLDRLESGNGKDSPIAGMVGRGARALERSAEPVRVLDALPTPDFTDYFDRLHASPLAAEIEPKLLVETARGCWWGEKQHCTFCGLNAESMAFRVKSPQRALSEIADLVATYGVSRIDCVDNILHMGYLETLLPMLAEAPFDLELFYETKANLRLEQLRTMRRAGVSTIQPGIESFSDEVLGLMRKGCSCLQNLQVLRWATDLGMEVIWNILYGFPGESEDEYDRMADLVPLLTHLRPPTFAVPIRLDRFSPNFTHAASFGLVRVRPAAAYGYVFDLPAEEIENLAYFFEFEYADGRRPHSYTERLREEIQAWASAHARPPAERPRLDLLDAGGLSLINDTRPAAVRPTHVLRGAVRRAHLLCDRAESLASLCRQLPDLSTAEVETALRQLVEAKLVVERKGRFLSLARFPRHELEEPERVRSRPVASCEESDPAQGTLLGGSWV